MGFLLSIVVTLLSRIASVGSSRDFDMPSVLSELSKTHDDEPKIEAATAAQCVLFCVSSHIKIYFFKKLHLVINQ